MRDRRVRGRSAWGRAMDVAAWLRGLGLGEYEAAFRANGVDVSVLPELTADDRFCQHSRQT